VVTKGRHDPLCGNSRHTHCRSHGGASAHGSSATTSWPDGSRGRSATASKRLVTLQHP
jgi:hypothetical protein